jgi:alkaline phosphatase D
VVDRRVAGEDGAPVTVLGEEQWAWLEAQLERPGFSLRVVCSSLSFAPSYTGFEAWSLFPLERQRLLDTVARTRAEGVVVLSGDVHYGEISVIEPAGEAGAASDCGHADGCPRGLGYPLFDATASGITQASSWLIAPPNSRRATGTASVGGPGGNNWGRLSLDFAAAAGGGGGGGGGGSSSSSSSGGGSVNPTVRLEIFNESGFAAATVAVPLGDLRWKQ